MTTKEVCQKYGVSREYVCKWARNHGVRTAFLENRRGGYVFNDYDLEIFEKRAVKNWKK